MNTLRSSILSLCAFLIFSINAEASFIYANGALKAGYGSTSTPDNTTVPSTKLAAYGAEANLGIHLFGFILGAGSEYALWKQLTDPSKVSNINTQGKLITIYPMLAFEFASFRLLGKLPLFFKNEYTLDQVNSSGNSVVYKDADAFAVQLHWNSGPFTFWGIEYQKATFKKVLLAANESTLTDNTRLKMSSLSLLYGIHF